MPTAEFLRHKALECRQLIAKATNAAVIAQLELWAREFEEEEAAKAEMAAASAVVIITPSSSSEGST